MPKDKQTDERWYPGKPKGYLRVSPADRKIYDAVEKRMNDAALSLSRPYEKIQSQVQEYFDGNRYPTYGNTNPLVTDKCWAEEETLP